MYRKTCLTTHSWHCGVLASSWPSSLGLVNSEAAIPATAPFGPELVSPDEIADLSTVTVTTRLNGDQVQHAAVPDMIFPIPKIIAYISAAIASSAKASANTSANIASRSTINTSMVCSRTLSRCPP